MDPGTPPPAHSESRGSVFCFCFLLTVSWKAWLRDVTKGCVLSSSKQPKDLGWKGKSNISQTPTRPHDKSFRSIPSTSRHVPRPHTAMVSKAILVTQVSWYRCCGILTPGSAVPHLASWLCWPRSNVGGVAVADITFHGFNQLVSLFAHEWHDSTDTCRELNMDTKVSKSILTWFECCPKIRNTPPWRYQSDWIIIAKHAKKCCRCKLEQVQTSD